MSFILDALKKSESDRQRQNAPDISDVPTAAKTAPTPRWLLIVIGLLVINLVVLMGVLIYPMRGSEPASEVSVSEPAAATVARTPRPAEVQPEPTPQLAPPPATMETPATTTDSAVTREPYIATVLPEPVVETRAPATQTQLTFNDLRASGNVSLPDMNIDIHVFSEKPSDRFVFINMNQYRENTTLAEGPLLREITTEGAILEYAGAIFLLPKD